MRTLAPQTGGTLIVSAAASGVGLITAQHARKRGARVIGIAADEHADLFRGIVVETVAHGHGLDDRLRALMAGDSVDAFADCHGNGYVDLAGELGVAPERINTTIDFEGAKWVGAHASGMMDTKDPAAVIARLAGLAADGGLFLPIRASFPLTLVHEAYKALGKGHGIGKIVLRGLSTPGEAARSSACYPANLAALLARRWHRVCLYRLRLGTRSVHLKWKTNARKPALTSGHPPLKPSQT